MHYKNFNTNLFVVFDQLWRTRSVSEAADALCVSQPAVSSALKKLREYFSDKLFDWVDGEMKPTPKADILIVEIREVLERTEVILDQSRFDPLSANRSISVSTADYVMGAIGPYVLDCIKEEAPHLRLDFTPFESQMASFHGTRAADMYIFPKISITNANYTHKVVHRDRYVLIACKSNKVVKQNISIDQFFETPKVAFSAMPNGIDNHEFSWFRHSHELNLKVLLPNYSLIPFFILNSQSIALVPVTLLRLFQTFASSGSLESPFKIIDPPVDLPIIEAGLYWDPVYEQDSLHSWLRSKIEEAAAISDQRNQELLFNWV